jgi:hypothetical protein
LINNSANRLLLAEYYESQSKNEVYLKSLQAQETDVSRKLNNILKAIENGIFNDTTSKRMNELELQQEMLKDEIEAEINRQKHGFTLNQVVRFIHSFVGDMNKVVNIKRVLELFVKKIYVSENKMVFTFYYSDDTREIEIDEMKAYIDNLEAIFSFMNITVESSNLKKKKKDLTENKKDAFNSPYYFSLECSHTDSVNPLSNVPHCNTSGFLISHPSINTFSAAALLKPIHISSAPWIRC